jgi:hypothetical protein
MSFLGISIPNPLDLIKDVENVAQDLASGNVLGALGDVAGIAGGLDPLSAMVESVGSAIGLPQPVLDAIKVAGGALTGDFNAVLSGATDGLSRAGGKAAQTNYAPSMDSSAASAGYAPPPTTPANSELTEKLQALQTLKDNFTAFDQAVPAAFGALGNAGDMKIGTDEFQYISDNPSQYSPEMVSAARYFLDHPDVYAAVGISDGIIPAEVDNAIASTKGEIAYSGAPASNCDPSTQVDSTDWSSSQPVDDVSGQIDGIINNPNMSLEDKIMAVLMLLEEAAQKDVRDDMSNLSGAQKKNQDAVGGKDDKAKQEGHDDVTNATNQLQRDSERLNQLNSLMSNIEKMFNDMKMTAIRNIGQ